MFLRLAREVASSAAKRHGRGLPGPPCSGSSAASRARRLPGAPSPPPRPAPGTPATTGLQDFVGAFAAGSPAASRCGANVCTALASRWMSSTADSRVSENKVISCQQDVESVGIASKKNRSILDVNDPDHLDPDIYFSDNLILVDLDNALVSNSEGRKKVPDDICGTFHSLLDLVVEHHLDGKVLLEALDEGNLLINVKTKKFVLKERKFFKWYPDREKLDFMKVHDLIVGYVERSSGIGSKEQLPEVCKDFLNKLKASCLNVKLLYLHPMFLSWLDKVLFRFLSDICVKPANQTGDKRAFLNVVGRMPYVKSALPGQDSGPSLKSIVENNKVLDASNKHRDEAKDRRDNMKKKQKARAAQRKEEKKRKAAAGGGPEGEEEKRQGDGNKKNQKNKTVRRKEAKEEKKRRMAVGGPEGAVGVSKGNQSARGQKGTATAGSGGGARRGPKGAGGGAGGGPKGAGGGAGGGPKGAGGGPKGNQSVGGQEVTAIAGSGGVSKGNQTAGGGPVGAGGGSKRNQAAGGAAGGGEAKQMEPAAAGGSGRPMPDPEAIERGIRLICLNRDGFSHLGEIATKLGIRITLEKLCEMLHFEFPAYEFRLLDLLEEGGIWHVHHMDKILKVPDWKLQAIIRMDRIRLARSRSG